MPKNEKRKQLSSSLTINEEQKLSQHFIENNDTPKSNRINNDEHKQIASYTNQLALITEKQYFNQTGIQTQIKVPRPQKGYVDHQRAEKKLIISKLEAENR
jgi:hypothetical protein